MPTPSPRLAIAATLAALALTLTGCASEATETAPAATVETATVETATVETATPVAELDYAGQVKQAWLESWAVNDFSEITQPPEGEARLAAYIVEVRSDAPGEVAAVIAPPEAVDPVAVQHLADRELATLQNVGTVDVQKLTITTADGTASAVSGGATE